MMADVVRRRISHVGNSVETHSHEPFVINPKESSTPRNISHLRQKYKMFLLVHLRMQPPFIFLSVSGSAISQ
jgi:hypothetical protein